MRRKTFQLTSEDARGEKNNNARLTPDNVRDIRKRNEAGETNVQIAKHHRVAASTISCIVTGRRWGHVR